LQPPWHVVDRAEQWPAFLRLEPFGGPIVKETFHLYAAAGVVEQLARKPEAQRIGAHDNHGIWPPSHHPLHRMTQENVRSDQREGCHDEPGEHHPARKVRGELRREPEKENDSDNHQPVQQKFAARRGGSESTPWSNHIHVVENLRRDKKYQY